MRFSALYQLVWPFVKQNLCLRGVKLAGAATIMVLVICAAVPGQGFCLTAEEIAYLKESGVSDETIQLMIRQENERGRPAQTGIWEVEDEKGNRSTLYQVGNGREALERDQAEEEKVNRAWEMLRNLIIDARERE
jgi:hypothetical protein